MNTCMFRGRLVREPEIIKFENGAVGKFSIAVRSSYKNKKTGEYETTFVDFKVWNKLALTFEKYAFKGMDLIIRSRFTIDQYEKDGEKKKAKYFTAEDIEFISSGKKQKNNNESNKNIEDISVDQEIKDLFDMGEDFAPF